MKGDRKQRPRGPHQLPPGRHGLPRGYVAANQRERILDAVADVVSLTGYSAMSVEEIIGAAGVSRRTFYDNFGSKEEAFMAALENVGGQLLQRVAAAYETGETFTSCVLACLAAFLEFLASEPRYADMCIVEVLAAGPPAIERRNAVMEMFAGLLHAGSETVEGGIRPPALTAETIIGGIYEIVYSRVLQGKAAELPGLLPDVAYSMMMPYIGHEAAVRETRPTPAGSPA